LTAAPPWIGKVALTVYDLARVNSIYQQSVGLHLLRADARSAALGVDRTTLRVGSTQQRTASISAQNQTKDSPEAPRCN